MTNKDYQMVTVCEYVKMLDNEPKYLNNSAAEIKANVEKYLLSIRRAQTNAKILESLLA